MTKSFPTVVLVYTVTGRDTAATLTVPDVKARGECDGVAISGQKDMSDLKRLESGHRKERYMQ